MTLIYFILILGIVILVHEFGHFIFAKRAGIYVYEFSIGMGPRIFKWTRKNDETEYSIRLIPIGGFVQMAGEEIEDDKSVPKDKKFSSKTFGQQLITCFAGIMNNFILAIVLLFIIALFNGAPQGKPIVGSISKDYPAYTSGLQKGDVILKLDGKNASNTDLLSLELQVHQGKTINLTVDRDGEEKNIILKPKKTLVDGKETYKYGFAINDEVKRGFLPALEYAFSKFFSLIWQMIMIFVYLFTGHLSFASLAGPVGIYGVVGTAAASGLWSLVSLTAYISINVGFINLIPLPAFDGGRIFILLIEKITGKKINPRIENTFHAIGFFLLMLLMVLITYNDIIRMISG